MYDEKMESFDDGQVKEIIQIGIEGEFTRGDNGAVLVDTVEKKTVYLLTHEFQPLQFQEQLNDLISEEKQFLYVVVKDASNMHIVKIPKGI